MTFVSSVADPGWVKIRIRDKHTGSATLVVRVIVTICQQFCCLGDDKNESNNFLFFIFLVPVLRIRDVYPGSRILNFTHPGSKNSSKREG
jgi:hypothetical protein